MTSEQKTQFRGIGEEDLLSSEEVSRLSDEDYRMWFCRMISELEEMLDEGATFLTQGRKLTDLTTDEMKQIVARNRYWFHD
jgi:hypothetical protein